MVKKKKYPKCEICGYRHKNYEDGFDYLSCMLEIKRNKKKRGSK